MAKSLEYQIVARALEIISDEARWTKAVVARKADGRCCEFANPLAAQFCAVGALSRAAYELLGARGVESTLKAVKFVLAADNRPPDSLPLINDQEGHAAIVAMFKRALAH